jgi:hypothetical protein
MDIGKEKKEITFEPVEAPAEQPVTPEPVPTEPAPAEPAPEPVPAPTEPVPVGIKELVGV